MKRWLKWSGVVTIIVSLGLLFSLVGTFGGSAPTGACGNDPNIPAIDSKTMEDNADQVYSHVKKSFPEATVEGLSGMIGNFQQESQVSPKSIERSDDPLSGHGLAQWTSGRATALINFAKQKGKEWSALDLQIEYLISELKGSEKGSVSVLKETDVHQATLDWQTKFERAGVPAIQNRLKYADQWYARFGSHDPGSSSAIGNASDGDSEVLECDSGESGDIVKTAKSLMGYFHYSQPKRTQFGTVEKPDKEGFTDCSSFVWLVLTKAGYKTPSNVGWFTGSMTLDARDTKQWLKAVPEGEARAGDIVIVNQGAGAGDNGHTGILAEKWHGKETEIIQEGGNGDRVNIDAFGTSFMSLIEGGDICLARPIKK
ncbi:phage tail tip lysozyme [Enterococcus sp. AZ196]|uniref:phage tail tip lysozyme n=1 Tax=Enterococcus sp. AZ196 TaxID=2774659 RepID=UPI003D27C95B